MKLNVQWLREYVDSTNDIEELSNELTMSGSEVEEIERPFEKIYGVVSAKVVEVKPHSNADKLNVCKVNTGEKEYITITSDLSIEVGDLVAFASALKASTVDGTEVKPSVIRGIETEGMMLSLEEIGLESHSDHVFKFGERVKIGRDIKEILDLDLITFELEITPNRPDCLSHVGLAREVAAVEGKDYRVPQPSIKLPNADLKVSVESNGCWRYMVVRVDNVKVKNSPLWLKRRLASVGLRSINNIADATNYMMMELGHPIHAFDYDKIPSSKLIVRNAQKGEKLLALNSKEYEFSGGELLITDGEIPLAIAGVIGGKESGVTNSTKRVLLEIATFDPVQVRKASKSLNISTDASFRFERGVDPNDTEIVAGRLAEMIIELGGGDVIGATDIYPNRVEKEKVFLSREKISSYTAHSSNSKKVVDSFERLGMDVIEKDDGWLVTVPTFRRDILEDVDLIEEFARIYGLDNLPKTHSLPFIFTQKNAWWEFKSKVKKMVMGLGYYEVLTYPFVDPKIVDIFYSGSKKPDGIPKIINALSPEMSMMRPDLVFGLLNILAYNVKHQRSSVRLFEIGRIFSKSGEREMMAMISTGRMNPEDYTDKRNVALLNIKGDLENVFDSMHVDVGFSQKSLSGFEEGRSGEIILDGETIGKIGEISKDILKFLDVKLPVYFTEVNMNAAFKNEKKAKYRAYSQYPLSFKDISMFIEKGKVKAEEIVKAAKESSQYVMSVGVSDLYTGKSIPKTVYSLTITISYGSMEKTLSDNEINEAFMYLVNMLDSKEGITVRKV